MRLQRPVEDLVRRSCGSQELSELVGESPLFLKSIEQLPAIAKSEASVLISGETGTGKELVAQLTHRLSMRAAFPFVAVNCGSFSDALLEDELFGHERGAFTGAERCRNGLIAQAQCGTLFLDEVDTMPPKAQIDLLRVLQDMKFRTIGSTLERDADVRVVAGLITFAQTCIIDFACSPLIFLRSAIVERISPGWRLISFKSMLPFTSRRRSSPQTPSRL